MIIVAAEMIVGLHDPIRGLILLILLLLISFMMGLLVERLTVAWQRFRAQQARHGQTGQPQTWRDFTDGDC